jgi:dihydroxyacetone kinase-like predicted kinase
VATIAAEIAALGDCPLVEGDEHLVKVHVHVFDPGVALSYGVATGFITDVVVENMDDMAAAMQEQTLTPPLNGDNTTRSDAAAVAGCTGARTRRRPHPNPAPTRRSTRSRSA